MNVWMAGLDDSVFHNGESNTVARLGRYLETLRQLEPNSTLTDLILTRQRVQPIAPQDGLRFIPVRSPRILFPIAGALTALRLGHHLRPDVITTQDPLETGLLGLILKRAFRAPLEVQLHFNLLSPYWLAEHRWWNRLRLALARFVLAHADAIRVVSSPLKRALIDAWAVPDKRIAIIPVPVLYEHESFEETSATPPRKVVLFVGRLYYPKNLPGLFAVIEKVLESHPDATFILVGDGPQRDYARKRAAALSDKSIHLLGTIPYADLPRYYHSADLLVLPSLYEGFGRVVLESYLCRTPVVATRCGGPEDIIVDGETGFLTLVEDMEGFAKRVSWLLDHPTEAKHMGEKGYERVRQQFQPEKLIEQMVQQWRQIAT